MSRSRLEPPLPLRPRPLPDESLTSWLRRLAVPNCTDVPSFFETFWPKRALLARDLDKWGPDFLLADLAQLTALPLEVLRETTLRPYEGVLFESIPAAGRCRWVLPLGIANRVRTRFGQQWCPRCLEEDAAPYYRRRWRLAIASSCPAHGVILKDRCHACGRPAMLHKGKPHRCIGCDADRREAPTVTGDGPALVLEFRLGQILDPAAARWTAIEALHPLAYYGLVHHVLSMLVRSPRSQALRHEIARRWGGDPRAPEHPHSERVPEALGVEDRHRMMGLTARLLEGWPWRFVAACGEAQLWRTWIFGNRRYDEAPYAIVRPVIDYLTYPRPRGPTPTANTRYERPFHTDGPRRKL